MSTKIIFSSSTSLTIEQIEILTPIRHVINSSKSFVLFYNGNYVVTNAASTSKPFQGFIIYSGNNPYPILKFLIEAFDLMFYSEYSIQEQLNLDVVIDDAYMREYRRAIVDEINSGTQTGMCMDIPGNGHPQEYDVLTIAPNNTNTDENTDYPF